MADKKQVQSRIFLGLYALLFLGLVVFVVFQLRQNKLGNIIEDGNILSILVTVYQEDTPILNEVVFLSAESGKAAILDIPTNSGSLIESKALIAGLDVLFDPRDPQAYIEQINQFTGYPIQFHMFFDLAGQKSFIDILGGIEVFVSDAQEYIQPENIIMLPAGSVRLDGDKSQSFLSFSTPEESSADRVSRYQRWVQAIFQGIGDQEELLSFPEVQSLLRETLQTNIDELSFQSLISTLATSDLEQVIYMRLLGEERMVDNQRLIFPYDEGVPLRNGVMETFESLKNTRIG
jgi:anionic cell wall polymer biosynthesis LytR-Cps2A-Psr (LCP) family protein